MDAEEDEEAVGQDPGKVIKTARKYTTKARGSSQVWLARLEAEKTYCSRSGVEGQRVVVSAWKEARESVTGKEEDVLKVWIWGLGDEEAKLVGDKRRIHEVCVSTFVFSGILRGVWL